MKNLIIAVLSTIIFYTQFCEIKIPYIMPVFTLCVFIIASGIDEAIYDYRRSVKRGEKLKRKLRRAI